MIVMKKLEWRRVPSCIDYLVMMESFLGRYILILFSHWPMPLYILGLSTVNGKCWILMVIVKLGKHKHNPFEELDIFLISYFIFY